MSRRRGERGRRLRPPPSPGPTRSPMEVNSWRFRQICCRKLDAPGVASAASGMDARGRVYGGMRLTILTFDTAARRFRSPRVSICPPSLADFLSPFGSPRSQIEQAGWSAVAVWQVEVASQSGGAWPARTFVATRNVIAGHCDAARGGSLRRARGNHTRIEPPPPPRVLLRGAPSRRRAPARRRRARRELGEGRSGRERDGRVS